MTRAEVRRGRWSSGLATLAVIWSLGLIVWGAVGPASSYTSTSTQVAEDGSRVIEKRSGHSTLVEENGSWVLALLSVPALVSTLVWARLWRACTGRSRGDGRLRLAWSLITAMLVFCFVSIFTIGPLILPVVILLAAAAALVPVVPRQPVAAPL